MKKRSWAKRGPIKNYFPLPNEIYSLGLPSTAIAVYGYLLRREDRKSYQCLVSYRMIGEAVGKCVNTVRKYVVELEERGLIRTERTTITTRDGRRQNGCLRCTILPIQTAIGAVALYFCVKVIIFLNTMDHILFWLYKQNDVYLYCLAFEL